ncbi:MAG: hypothetical protein ACM31C_21775 [Acidobacteriota bacterium]
MRAVWLLAVAACGYPMPQQTGSDATPDSPPGTATIGGAITGLTGTGLVLRDNGGDDLAVLADGGFAFATPVALGSAYAVTVGVQPTNPSQDCTISGGTGVASGDVNSVQVTCVTQAFHVSGNVIGLATGLTVTLGSETVTPSGNKFQFQMPVASGSSFQVTTTKSGCAVHGGTGVVGTGDVTNVSVVCSTTSGSLGGSVSGLDGTVHLQNGTDVITVSWNGQYTFDVPVGSSYDVVVAQQPAFPPVAQTCTVANGTSGGAIQGSVSNVNVTCTTNKLAVGGQVTGLGTMLVLQDAGGDDLTVSGSGPFMFATKLASGSVYAVTVKQQPAGQTCTVTNARGTVTDADVTSVAVSCQ